MIYLDNAATGGFLPRPVLEAVAEALTHPANPGRSAHEASLSALARVTEARSALADAVVACNLVYSVSPQFDPFGANLSESMSLLLCGIGAAPELDIINNREEPEDPSLPKGLYYMMREADIQPFLERTLIPAAQAYQEHRDEMLDWGWLAGEDGIVYVEEIENPDTLRFGDPFLVSVEPLGGDRYLVVEELRDALGQWM